MKLLINCSTLSGTGVTQVAVSFIKECVNFNEHKYYVFLSPTMTNELKDIEFPSNFIIYNFDAHPIYGLDGFKIRRQLKQLENKISPDCVFSVFGPSWWTPSKPHLAGYAYPHYVYEDSPFFQNISFVQKIKISIFKKIHITFLKRNSRFFVTEATDVSKRLISILNCKSENVFTVSNTYNDYFIQNSNTDKIKLLPEKDKDEFRFLSLCSFAPHKNLVILNKVIPLLQEIDSRHIIKFVLTVDPVLFEKLFEDKVKKSLINLGRINVDKCPQLYRECDALFLPTTLECFSANYPEAMIMKKPILTSNLSFATSVCAQGALYFDPYNPIEIASVIRGIVGNTTLQEELVRNAYKQLSLFLTPKERAQKYLDICQKIIEK